MPSFRVNSKLVPILTLCTGIVWAQSTPSPSPPTESPAPSPTQTTSQAPAAPQTQTPSPPPPPTTFSASALRLDGIDFSGSVDGYYSFDDNHPQAGFNQLYNFNDKTNQADLNLLKLTVSHDPDPVGFRLDLGYGRTMDIIHPPGSTDPDFFRYVEQAYISVKPKGWKGFEADFGDFVTSAGAEVIESKDNWNYSRSLLFALAIPYYHFGLRTSMPIGSSLNVGVQVVNGWNEIVNPYGGNMKTVGITGALTRKKYTWSNNYYIGPQYTATNNRNRALYDTTLLLTPNDKVNAYLNFDYGQQRRLISGLDHWVGFAGALHFQLTKRFAISPRAEYYNDATGFTTGTVQKLHEVTATGEYKMIDGLLGRLEFRRDGSNMPYFDHGTLPGVSKSETTLSVGMIAYFPIKH
ncbi:MAG TPA: porin [Bryobacteraceae bacterium]|nr:porin [Bryobacteraceae bacterium]